MFRDETPSPLRVVARGALAGYVGLAGMAALFKPVQALQGGSGGSPKNWDEAASAADFAHRFLVGVAHRKVSVDRAPTLNNVMHALYAPALGVWYGVFQESLRPRTLPHGLVFGATAWTMRITLLPTLDLDKPFWRYPLGKNALDASFHVAFGLSVAYGYREVARHLV